MQSSAIEGYLSDLIFLYGEPDSKPLSRAKKNFERLGFKSLLSLNHILGSIENSLYNRFSKFAQKKGTSLHTI
jgi:hypothetical protein